MAATDPRMIRALGRLANLTFAVNRDHSLAYIQAVARRLEEAVAAAGPGATRSAIRREVLKELAEIARQLRAGGTIR